MRQETSVTPLVRATRLPHMAAEEAFVRLAGKGVFWLDSSLNRETDGRFSVMGCDPAWTFTSKDGRWCLTSRDGGVQRGDADAFHELDRLLDMRRVSVPPELPDLPFWGGAVGWLAYDLGRRFEQFDGSAIDDLVTPDLHLAWYDAALVWNHAKQELWIVGPAGPQGEGPFGMLAERLSTLTGKEQKHTSAEPTTVQSSLSKSEYMARVENVRGGIARGEYYQLNLVQRLTCAHHGDAASTYLRLRTLNPAPFSAYLDTDFGAVLSSSPERFLEVAPGGRIRTCPIKGTRPRGTTLQEDQAMRSELVASSKERAELLMIVDLLRNDLGRVCQPGTVSVERLHAVESFATVHHLVGEVVGQLRAGVTRRELLRAVFPGGSITGAPKVSAMHAIDRLEPVRRGIAMGSLGYFSAHGRIDLNIAIRTILCRENTAYISVGAGIVWDSDPASEYEETLTKARALLQAVGVTEVKS